MKLEEKEKLKLIADTTKESSDLWVSILRAIHDSESNVKGCNIHIELQRSAYGRTTLMAFSEGMSVAKIVLNGEISEGVDLMYLLIDLLVDSKEMKYLINKCKFFTDPLNKNSKEGYDIVYLEDGFIKSFVKSTLKKYYVEELKKIDPIISISYSHERAERVYGYRNGGYVCDENGNWTYITCPF